MKNISFVCGIQIPDSCAKNLDLSSAKIVNLGSGPRTARNES